MKPIIATYKGKDGYDYIFEYYDVDSFEELQRKCSLHILYR
jgi:hypothetical protein